MLNHQELQDEAFKAANAYIKKKHIVRQPSGCSECEATRIVDQHLALNAAASGFYMGVRWEETRPKPRVMPKNLEDAAEKCSAEIKRVFATSMRDYIATVEDTPENRKEQLNTFFDALLQTTAHLCTEFGFKNNEGFNKIVLDTLQRYLTL